MTADVACSARYQDRQGHTSDDRRKKWWPIFEDQHESGQTPITMRRQASLSHFRRAYPIRSLRNHAAGIFRHLNATGVDMVDPNPWREGVLAKTAVGFCSQVGSTVTSSSMEARMSPLLLDSGLEAM